MSEVCGSKGAGGDRKGELAMISNKLSFVPHPEKGKYHWLKNDVLEIKVD